MLDAISRDESSRDLERVLRGFHGAYPYLRFLAEQSGSMDPFRYEVAEAYWIGNSLLEKVHHDAFYQHLTKRLGAKFPTEHLKSFFKTRPYASFPHHSLHVFNAFSTMGTVPDSFASGQGTDDKVGGLMDKCRISWARVVDTSQQDLLVEYQPLARRQGKLRLQGAARARLRRQVDGTNLLPGVRSGDWVSAHWGFACTVLSPGQVSNLRKFTVASIDLANKTPVPG